MLAFLDLFSKRCGLCSQLYLLPDFLPGPLKSIGIAKINYKINNNSISTIGVTTEDFTTTEESEDFTTTEEFPMYA